MRYILFLLGGTAFFVALLCASIVLAGRLMHGPAWALSMARHRAPVAPRYPWTRPNRVDPHPDVAPLRALEVPPKPTTPPDAPAEDGAA